MSRWLLILSSFAACGIGCANPLYVSAAGQFSGSDLTDQLVSPNGNFSLSFVVDSNPVPVPGSISSLGFDVPVSNFAYTLNGTALSFTPSEIRFNRASNGGLFDITFGSGFTSSEFSFSGVQIFTGATAAPLFSAGQYPVSSWTYSDPSNYDTRTPTGALVSVAATPEPSSMLLFLAAALGFVGLKLRKQNVTR